MNIENNNPYGKDAYGYIYEIIIHDENSELNNKHYIGQRKCKNNHLGEIDYCYRGSGLIINDYRSKYSNQYLVEHSELIIHAWAKDKNELDKLEKKYITEEIVKNPNYLNLALGGTGGDKIIFLSEEKKEEHKRKSLAALKRKLSDTKEKNKIHKSISEYKTELYKDPEERERQVIRKLNSINNTKEREFISESLKRRWLNLSEEEKEEYRKKTKERMQDPKIREKLKNSTTGRRIYNNGLLQAYTKESPGEGWVLGRLYTKIPKEWKYFHKGTMNIRAPKCPEGFSIGRYSVTTEARTIKRKEERERLREERSKCQKQQD